MSFGITARRALTVKYANLQKVGLHSARHVDACRRLMAAPGAGQSRGADYRTTINIATDRSSSKKADGTGYSGCDRVENEGSCALNPAAGAALGRNTPLHSDKLGKTAVIESIR